MGRSKIFDTRLFKVISLVLILALLFCSLPAVPLLAKSITIQASAGSHGKISPAGAVAVEYGANQAFSVTPDAGYNVLAVQVDGAAVSLKNNIYTFNNVTGNHSITAAFTWGNNGTVLGVNGSSGSTRRSWLSTPTATPTPTPSPSPSSAPAVKVTPQAAPTQVTNNGDSPLKIKIDLNGRSVTANVSSAGKTSGAIDITSPDQGISLRIPDQTQVLTAKKAPPAYITITPEDYLPSMPVGAKLIGKAYKCFPGGTTFDPPITLVFHYDPSSLPSGTDESKLQVGFYNDTARQWEMIDGAVDLESHNLSAAVKHFSRYAVMAPPVKPAAVVAAPVVKPGAVVTSQAAKPGVAVLSPAVKPAAVVIAPTTTPLSEVNEPAVKPTAAVNPIIGNSPLIEQLPEPLALTPAPEQKPAASPYNPVLLLIEVSALVAIGITVIWLRKRTKNSTP